MPCFCHFFNKSNEYRAVEKKSSSKCDQNETIREGDVSASELARLKAEVWSLRNALAEASTANDKLQDAITQTVAEKYELLNEIQKAKNDIAAVESERQEERHLYCQEKDSFLQEIASYRDKINNLSFLVDRISNQNIELKQSLLEANDTVCKIGHKYMKLKSLGH